MGLLVAALLAASAFVATASYRQNRGYAWADNFCSTASMLCDAPGWLVMLTIIMSVLFIYRKTIPTD